MEKIGIVASGPVNDELAELDMKLAIQEESERQERQEALAPKLEPGQHDAVEKVMEARAVEEAAPTELTTNSGIER